MVSPPHQPLPVFVMLYLFLLCVFMYVFMYTRAP